MLGRHTEDAILIKRLENTIKLKDRELEETKISCAEIFRLIYKITKQNDLENIDVKLRKIAELAQDTQYELMKDIAIENDTDKIIELPTNQSK